MQAISDLITEFGLLSAPIFESSTTFRSTVGSFSYSIPSFVSTTTSFVSVNNAVGVSNLAFTKGENFFMYSIVLCYKPKVF